MFSGKPSRRRYGLAVLSGHVRTLCCYVSLSGDTLAELEVVFLILATLTKSDEVKLPVYRRLSVDVCRVYTDLLTTCNIELKYC